MTASTVPQISAMAPTGFRARRGARRSRRTTTTTGSSRRRRNLGAATLFLVGCFVALGPVLLVRAFKLPLGGGCCSSLAFAAPISASLGVVAGLQQPRAADSEVEAEAEAEAVAVAVAVAAAEVSELPSPTRQEEALLLFEEAKGLMTAGDLAAASVLFWKAMTHGSHPDPGACFALFVRCYELQGIPEQAHLAVAAAYVRQGQFMSARRHVGLAIELNPNEPHAYLLLEQIEAVDPMWSTGGGTEDAEEQEQLRLMLRIRTLQHSVQVSNGTCIECLAALGAIFFNVKQWSNASESFGPLKTFDSEILLPLGSPTHLAHNSPSIAVLFVLVLLLSVTVGSEGECVFNNVADLSLFENCSFIAENVALVQCLSTHVYVCNLAGLLFPAQRCGMDR